MFSSLVEHTWPRKVAKNMQAFSPHGLFLLTLSTCSPSKESISYGGGVAREGIEPPKRAENFMMSIVVDIQILTQSGIT